MTEAPPSFRDLLRLIARHAAFTFGGGSVTTIELERDIVEKSAWMSRDSFRTVYGLARLTPGTNILALATGLGWTFYRWPGALATLACASIPGSVLALLLAAGYQRIYGNPFAKLFLMGSAAAVCGFIAASLWRMVSPYLKGGQVGLNVLVFAVALALTFFGVPPFPVVIGLGLAGYFWPAREQGS